MIGRNNAISICEAAIGTASVSVLGRVMQLGIGKAEATAECGRLPKHELGALHRTFCHKKN